MKAWEAGTNDTSATDSDPTGGGAAGNNMVMVSSNEWDSGSAGGDGNLTALTQYVSATSGDTRVTAFGFDFRDRKMACNMTTMPQPGTPTRSFAAVYDAWLRKTGIDSGESPAGQYQYDGRNR